MSFYLVGEAPRSSSVQDRAFWFWFFWNWNKPNFCRGNVIRGLKKRHKGGFTDTHNMMHAHIYLRHTTWCSRTTWCARITYAQHDAHTCRWWQQDGFDLLLASPCSRLNPKQNPEQNPETCVETCVCVCVCARCGVACVSLVCRLRVACMSLVCASARVAVSLVCRLCVACVSRVCRLSRLRVAYVACLCIILHILTIYVCTYVLRPNSPTHTIYYVLAL